jgi:arylformamidase
MPTSRANAPVMVFLHGGAWRRRCRSQAYAAGDVRAGRRPLGGAGLRTVMDVGLDGMVPQVRRAVPGSRGTPPASGGDRRRVYVGGHSSVLHLAANVLVTDWGTDFGLPPTCEGRALRQGMYDLQRVRRLSARSSYVKFRRRSHRARAEPAQRHLRPTHLARWRWPDAARRLAGVPAA